MTLCAKFNNENNKTWISREKTWIMTVVLLCVIGDDDCW